MYSSKFWLSVSFQVAQKASTILAFPRVLQKQMKAADAGISGSRGHCSSKDPLHLSAAPAFLFREEAGGKPRIWAASTSLRRPSFPEAVDAARDGKGGGGRLGGLQSSLWLAQATGLAGQVASLPVLAAQPFCSLRNLCERFNEVGGRERKMREGLSDSAWKVGKGHFRLWGKKKEKHNRTFRLISVHGKAGYKWGAPPSTNFKKPLNCQTFQIKEAE